MSAADTTPGETLEYLVQNKPLSHPLVTALACFEYEYPPATHIREIYGSVYRAVSPEYPRAPKKLVRLEPREHAKSESGTVVTPTWAALQDPDTRILIMSETEDQAKGKLEECREHIERLAPRFGRTIDRSNKTELLLERDETYDVPTIKAAGFETGITGGHFDVIVFDDVVSWETQRTPKRRQDSWNRFQDYLNLGSEGESLYLVLGTRKHPQDLYHHLLEGPAWQSQVEQAIQDWSLVENGEYDVITDEGYRYSAEEISEIPADHETIVEVEPYRDVAVLWPERWPLETLLLDMITGFGSERGSLVWRRENQNDATALQGQVLKQDMLSYVPRLPDSGLRWTAALDPGIEDDPEKAAEGDTDYWALSFVANHARRELAVLVDVQRRRGMTLAEGIQWVKGRLNDVERKYGCSVGRLLAESVQAQRWFVQTARDEGLQVEPVTSTGKKEDRIIDMTALFESGRVKLLEDGSGDGWESFIQEWVGFPSAAHDDQLDSVEIALRELNDNGFQKSRHDIGAMF